jgi:hypothetical protein
MPKSAKMRKNLGLTIVSIAFCANLGIAISLGEEIEPLALRILFITVTLGLPIFIFFKFKNASLDQFSSNSYTPSSSIDPQMQSTSDFDTSHHFESPLNSDDSRSITTDPIYSSLSCNIYHHDR